MNVYLDESLTVHGPSLGESGISLEQLVKGLGERLNPGRQGTESERKRVDEARLKLLGVSVELFPYGTVVFGPNAELASRQHAAAASGFVGSGVSASTNDQVYRSRVVWSGTR